MQDHKQFRTSSTVCETRSLVLALFLLDVNERYLT
jgi:hypothetical protein